MLKATVKDRQQAEEYWLIIACSKNMLALHLPENDRTIGMPEEGKVTGKGGWGLVIDC